MTNIEAIIQLKAFEDGLPLYFCKREEMCFSTIVKFDEELEMFSIDKIELMEDKIVLTNKNGV